MRVCEALLVFACALSGACPSTDEGTVIIVRPPPEPRRPAAKANPEEALFDAQGVLRESERVIAGLRLPVGLEPLFERDRYHEFVSSLPAEKLLRYFGPRLITGIVDQRGEETVYREAVPRGVVGGVVKLDVAVRAVVGGKTVVGISEVPPPPAGPVTPEAIRRFLEERAKTAN